MENEVNRAVDECPLWRHFRSGDQGALAVIFSENYDSLYFYGKKLVRDEDMVKDCVQNLFLKIWSTREKLMAVKFVRAYLLKSLRRHIADQVMAQMKKEAIQHQFFTDFDITFSHEDFLISLQTSEDQRKALTRSLNNLPARQREALFLRFYEDLEYAKIAEVMGLNVQSVRNLICQSLKAVKDQMNLPVPLLIKVGSQRR